MNKHSEKILDLRNDKAFKKVFSNSNILIHLLNDILERTDHNKIVQIDFKPTEQIGDINDLKFNILDILCTDAEGHHFNIEMQLDNTGNFIERSQFYAYRTYVKQLKKGESYNRLKPVYYISFVGYNLFPEATDYFSRFDQTNIRNRNQKINGVDLVFIEIPKFNKTISDISEPTDIWAYSFAHSSKISEQDIKKLAEIAPIMKEVYTELNKFNWTRKELDMYDISEKERRDRAAALEYAKTTGKDEGLELGREEGREEGEKNALAKLLNLKFGKSADKYIELIFNADEKKIQHWLSLILTVNKIEDMFKD